jgi:lipid-binding SYLF domain-containing protein
MINLQSAPPLSARKPAGVVRLFGLLLGLVLLSIGCATSTTSNRAVIDADSTYVLQQFYAQNPDAANLAKQAKAVLIFPNILKGGLIIGALHGYGALRINDRTDGYYSISAASYGLQAGLQKYSFVFFLMNDSAVDYLRKSHGWEIGVGPSIVFGDYGAARSYTSTTLRSDVYAFTFDQSGLMAGLGLQGSKISEYNPD